MRPRVEALFDVCGARFHLREKLFEFGESGRIEDVRFPEVMPYLGERVPYFLQRFTRALRRLPAQLAFRYVAEDIGRFNTQANRFRAELAIVLADIVAFME